MINLKLFIRFLDIVFSISGLIILSPVLLLVLVLGFFDTGLPLFKQERVGKECRPFWLP